MTRKKENRLEATEHSKSKTRNQRRIDFLRSTPTGTIIHAEISGHREDDWRAAQSVWERMHRCTRDPFEDLRRGAPRRQGENQTIPVGSRAGAVLRRRSLSVSPRFLWECLTSRTVSPFPAPRHIARSVRLSRTTRSCTLPAKGYVTYRAGASFGESTRYRTR